MAASTEKVTIDDATENSVFTSFKRDENKLADLKYAITALNEGYNKMNVILTKIVDLNARSSVIFSEATCTTVPVEKYVVASIFQKGIDVLEHYVHSENKIKVPADVRQRNALCKLLCFLTEDNTAAFLELERKKLENQEGDWALNILQHLLTKLAGDNKFVIEAYPSPQSLPLDESKGQIGDTSFGCEKGWHGSVDILLENNLPVHLFKSTQPDNQSESSAPSNHCSEMNESHLIAQTIVFSFLQHKYNGMWLKHFLVPAIGISASHLYVNMYDCENDVLLSSEKELKISSGGKLFVETVVLLWLVLNYRDFCTGITEEMIKSKAGFHRRVDDDHLLEYCDNVKRPFHMSSKKRENSAFEAFEAVRGRKVKRLFKENEYIYLEI